MWVWVPYPHSHAHKYTYTRVRFQDELCRFLLLFFAISFTLLPFLIVVAVVVAVVVFVFLFLCGAFEIWFEDFRQLKVSFIVFFPSCIFTLLLCSLRLLVYSPFSINFGAKLSVCMVLLYACAMCMCLCFWLCRVVCFILYVSFSASIFSFLSFFFLSFFFYLMPLHFIALHHSHTIAFWYPNENTTMKSREKPRRKCSLI